MIPETRCHCGAGLHIVFSDPIEPLAPVVTMETCSWCGMPPGSCRCDVPQPTTTATLGA